MHTITEDVIAWGTNDPDAFSPLTGLTECCDTRILDDSDLFKPMKGILIATPIGLSLWVVIILALLKLF